MALAGSPLHAASIGLYSDPACASCNLQILVPPGVGTLYVTASTAGLFWGDDMAGAEFRVEGLPPGWVAFSTPSPQSAVSLGDPLGAGANIAFATAQYGDCILLYTVTLWPAYPGAAATLRVTAHSAPSSPQYPCPLLVPGDGLCCFCRACVDAGILWVNTGGDCTIATAPSTWTLVKGLFRD